MQTTNVFKMEMFKNFRDRIWLWITGSLGGLMLLATIMVLIAAHFSVNSWSDGAQTIFFGATYILVLVSVIGFFVYGIGLPFHLLSQDYSNKALSLMVASGVKRVSYYWIKLLATLVTTFLALLEITIIPLVLVMGIYSHEFIHFVDQVVHGITLNLIWAWILQSVPSGLASLALLFLTVIITRGEFWGLFVYFGLGFGVNFVTSILMMMILLMGVSANPNISGAGMVDSYFLIASLISLIELIIYILIGILVIKRQDL